MARGFAWTRDRRGGVAVMAAIAGALACLMAAVVVDLGSVALQARQVQGAADLAALSAVSDLTRAQAGAEATAQANLGPGVRTVVVTGLHTADRGLAPQARFAPGAGPMNAARVTLTSTATLYFGRWILRRDTVEVTRTATAATAAGEPLAMISIGSRLARLDGGVANQLLSGLTGSRVSLTVMDYQALADADVSLLAFNDALATELDLTAGDYQALLTHSIDAGRALGVMETLVGGQAGSALDRLGQAAAGLEVRLGDLIGLEAEAPQSLSGALDAEVAALDLASALLEVGAGDRQVRLDMGARAGLASLDVWLAIGERPNRSPWLTVSDRGEPIIRTAQARLYLEAVTAQKLSGLAQVRLPVLIELAASEARLERIACADGVATVTVGVRPGVARAWIGAVDRSRLDDFQRPMAPSQATLLSVLGLVRIKAFADIEAADAGFTALGFSPTDIHNQSVRTTASRGFVGGMVASLIARLNVDVEVIGLGLGLGNLTAALGALLRPLGPVLDGVVQPVLDVLGLRFGEADVTVHGATCPEHAHAPVLVS
ncbi:TadG family pilus assembly protein [Brevundimonas sp.]|uniref:TadG family pilus assembly protein n=1 Tax=Brevundimonas sp. TaxID=1871086 RepID=UPI002AB876FD|nr:TadG family pilus assembly protein [Brevundimonas sp.]MDZ4363781.1 TadG family pilus assembly protein [Brevundimonas sp.]